MNLTKANRHFAEAIRTADWTVNSMPGHPWEVYRFARTDADNGVIYQWACIICGSRVGPNDDDWCETPRCVEMLQCYRRLNQLVGQTGMESSGWSAYSDRWKTLRDAIFVVPDDEEYST